LDSLDLTEAFKQICFINIIKKELENKELENWEYETLKAIWDFYIKAEQQIISKRWTEENITNLIKKYTERFQNEIEKKLKEAQNVSEI